jgi:hypothetical protein
MFDKKHLEEAKLTKEQIEILNELSEDQKVVIKLINEYDKNKTASDRTSEMATGLEKDFRELTGIEKKQDEKYFTYIKRSLSEMIEEEKGKVTKQVTDKDAEIAEWKEKFEKKDADATLKEELAKANEKINEFPDILKKKDDDFKQILESKEKSLKETNLASYFAKSMPSMDKFKEEHIKDAKYLEYRKKEAIEEVKNSGIEIKWDDAYNPTFEKDYTKLDASELLSNKLKDLFAPKRAQSGGGAGKNTEPPEKKVILADLKKAQTQVQADEIIHKILQQKGLARGSTEYDTEGRKIKEDNKINQLPLQ